MKIIGKEIKIINENHMKHMKILITMKINRKMKIITESEKQYEK